jgi:hypothetical protein
MKTSNELDAVLPALAKVKAELEAVSKSSNNPFFKSKYADLNTHLDEVEPRLAKEGLLLLQPVNTDIVTGNSTVESRIYHTKTGQYVSSEMSLVLGKSTMQDAGSAVTYARRYTLGALLSMKAEDDDANKISGRDNSSRVQTTRPTPTPTTSTLAAKMVETTKTQADNAAFDAIPAPTKTEAAPTTTIAPLKTSRFSNKSKAASAPATVSTPAATAGDDSGWN